MNTERVSKKINEWTKLERELINSDSETKQKKKKKKEKRTNA